MAYLKENTTFEIVFIQQSWCERKLSFLGFRIDWTSFHVEHTCTEKLAY